MEKRMVIIGAGIAGLSSGCYALMNGYKTTIFEMHTVPGGLCTAWKRKGYTFDISMHMLTGSAGGAQASSDEGTYTVIGTSAGYDNQTKTNITVTAGATTNVSVSRNSERSSFSTSLIVR